MPEALLHATCALRNFGEVLARPERSPWPELPALSFRESVTGASPRQSTTVRLGWTPHEWRVLFHCEDSRAWATQTQRDAPLYEEEVVEIFFDPLGDLAAYFEIEVNPLNAVFDLVLRRNRSGYAKNFAWRCDGLQTAVTITETAWTAELAIPFSSVSAEPPKVGDRWRANFLRIDRPLDAPRELSAWAPTLRPTFHVPERFGEIEFVA